VELTENELALLERGLPKLDNLSAHLLVPFTVHKLRNAKVAWLNQRWFLERGLNVVNDEVRKRVEYWILESFAYLTPGGLTSVTALTKTTKVVHADRYGSTGGLAPHGGSGRAFIEGCFQVKGVGITPLVGDGAKPGHAHGCISIAESIREAIYAEIASAEFPHGAVPVVAVLDTGLYFSSPDKGEKYDQDVRRGLVVRPSIVRPAHVERAALFKRSLTGGQNSQQCDVKKSIDVAQYWVGRSGSTSSSVSPLMLFIGKVAEQAAFGQIHRFFSGGYFSSNLGIDGELIDFGNAHVLPDWSSARVLGHSAGFGKEMVAIELMARSLDFHFRKYAIPGSYCDNADSLIEHARSSYQAAFRKECLRLLVLESEAEEGDSKERGITSLLNYFRSQQRNSRDYAFGEVVAERITANNIWLYDQLLSNRQLQTSDNNPDSTSDLIREITSKPRASASDSALNSLRGEISALRFLKPRAAIDRAHLIKKLHELVGSVRAVGATTTESIDTLVQESIDLSRRHWQRLPADLSVIAQVVRGGCSALLCFRAHASEMQLWLEGFLLGDEVIFFEQSIAASEVAGLVRCIDSGRCHVTIPASDTTLMPDGVRLVAKWGVEIPPFSVTYVDNAEELWSKQVY
jgi:hypothetical protein